MNQQIIKTLGSYLIIVSSIGIGLLQIARLFIPFFQKESGYFPAFGLFFAILLMGCLLEGLAVMAEKQNQSVHRSVGGLLRNMLLFVLLPAVIIAIIGSFAVDRYGG